MNPFDLKENNINKSELIRDQVKNMLLGQSEIAKTHDTEIKLYRAILYQVSRMMGMKVATRTGRDGVLWIKRTR